MKYCTCSRCILTPCCNPLTCDALLFLQIHIKRITGWLFWKEHINHGPWGTKSPRLLTRGLWNLAASSKIVKWLEPTRVADLSLSEERHLCPQLFLTYLVVLLLIDRILPFFFHFSLTLVLLSNLWECEYYCLKDNSRVWEDICSQLWLSKWLYCSAASNTIRKCLGDQDKSSDLGRSSHTGHWCRCCQIFLLIDAATFGQAGALHCL